MKIKFISIFFLLFLSTILFAAKVNDVKFSDDNLIVDLVSKDEECIISADEESRLIYIEIPNLDEKSLKKFTKNLEEDIKNSNFFEDVIMEKNNDSLSLTLQIAPKVAYTMDVTTKKIELSLQRTSKNKHLIVIDPGHGGKDPGAMRKSVVEKKIVLSVGTYLKEELSKDFNVIMTRDSDFFVTLSERPKIANRNKAALFVSVHANASENKSANGVEVFYFSKKSSPYAERIANFENSIGEKYGESSDKIVQISGELAYKKNQENSIRLAKSIVGNIADSLNMRNGGVHGANFAVLRGFNGTGVLIELGFVSNSYDADILMDDDSRQTMAYEIAKSIKNYLTRWLNENKL